MKKNSQVKTHILPHTRAKLELYEKYLNRYLAILSRSQWISKINIYDIFCGTGIYKDGKAGSPIIAFNLIEKNREYYKSKNKIPKDIFLSVNDYDPKNIGKVKKLLIERNNDICEIEINQLDASEMFSKVIQNIKSQKSDERNLIFVDPYGYKDIHKNDLYNLLNTNKTEIILFLPIAHMHRFKQKAINDFDNISYQKLRNFIHEFFHNDHPICTGKNIDKFKFINYLKEAFTFSDEFYTASFYIQRNRGNFYALFFITSNILGLEKIVDVIWEIDNDSGRGYDLPKKIIVKDINQSSIFDKLDYKFESPQKKYRIDHLEKIINEYISSNQDVTNKEMTIFILKNQFRLVHGNHILSKLQNENKLDVKKVKDGKDARKNAFYLGYNNFNKSEKQLIFNLKSNNV